jgi:7-carboxy-7-deazaguanine synthase
MTYEVAEKFKSIQGEGCYAGTPMAFIRFVGCSVSKTVCAACDTDYEVALPYVGGGTYSPEFLVQWAGAYKHVCLTGGEPFDQDLEPLLRSFHLLSDPPLIHVETSGTVFPNFTPIGAWRERMWICVSPKPGYRDDMIALADEIKVIVPGLGVLRNGMCIGWPTIGDALHWALTMGKTVFLQPRNDKHDLNMTNLRMVQTLIQEYPQLRLSVQLHKLLHVQ